MKEYYTKPLWSTIFIFFSILVSIRLYGLTGHMLIFQIVTVSPCRVILLWLDFEGPENWAAYPEPEPRKFQDDGDNACELVYILVLRTNKYLLPWPWSSVTIKTCGREWWIKTGKNFEECLMERGSWHHKLCGQLLLGDAGGHYKIIIGIKNPSNFLGALRSHDQWECWSNTSKIFL